MICVCLQRRRQNISGVILRAPSGQRNRALPVRSACDIIDKLNATVVKILGTPDMKELWAGQGIEAATDTPGQFAARVRADYEKYGRLIKAAGIRPE
jgi:tripartite-type tricarboxylate transporter receptor subunit TctC